MALRAREQQHERIDPPHPVQTLPTRKRRGTSASREVSRAIAEHLERARWEDIVTQHVVDTGVPLVLVTGYRLPRAFPGDQPGYMQAGLQFRMTISGPVFNRLKKLIEREVIRLVAEEIAERNGNGS